MGLDFPRGLLFSEPSATSYLFALKSANHQSLQYMEADITNTACCIHCGRRHSICLMHFYLVTQDRLDTFLHWEVCGRQSLKCMEADITKTV